MDVDTLFFLIRKVGTSRHTQNTSVRFIQKQFLPVSAGNEVLSKNNSEEVIEWQKLEEVEVKEKQAVQARQVVNLEEIHIHVNSSQTIPIKTLS